MKPQQEMLEKWIIDYAFPLEVIEKACNICFQRLNRSDFKYIDGILSNWNKNNLKTLQDIEKNDSNNSSEISFGNYTNNNRKRLNNSKNINKDYNNLDKNLLGWYNND